MTRTSLKDVQGQSSCFNSFRLLFPCTLAQPHASVWLPFFSLVLHRQLHQRTCLFFRMLKNKWLRRELLWGRTIKNHVYTSVPMPLCISSVSVQRSCSTYHACNHHTYIIQDHIHYASDCPSVVRSIAIICPHSNLILSHGLFPVTTRKPKLCTVSLKEDHTRLSSWRHDQSSLH